MRISLVDQGKPSFGDWQNTRTHGNQQKLAEQYEAAWKAGENPRIEMLLESVPLEARQDCLIELLSLELDLRRRSGEIPLAEEYVARFPDQTDAVSAVFAALEVTLDQGPAASLRDTRDFALASSQADRQKLPEKPSPGDNAVAPELRRDIGRYRLIKLLGGGAFGHVYLARDPELDREVAIKIPRREQFNSVDAAELFLAEARKAAKLNHPGIVRVYDVGRTPDGDFYIVMEYIQGTTLEALLEAPGANRPEVVDLLIAVAEAVHFAHRAGFVHRDLKPANILVGPNGQPYVADFGLALHEDEQRRHSNDRSGTCFYMSPEQARGEAHRMDGRSDIWSLGVILYRMLTGRHPFNGSTRSEVLDEILHREPKPPGQICDNIPEDLERICLKCLAKPLSDRYTTGLSLADDLRKLRPEGNAATTSQHAKVGLWSAGRQIAIGLSCVMVVIAGSIYFLSRNLLNSGPGSAPRSVPNSAIRGLEGLAGEITVSSAPSDPNRSAAEWVISQEGIVKVQVANDAVTASTSAELPSKPFVLLEVALTGKHITDDDLKRLEPLEQLEALYLSDTPISDEGLLHIRRQSLRTLVLEGTRITDATFRNIQSAVSLRNLYLTGTSITDEGLRNIGGRDSLLVLSIGRTRITDEGLRALGGLHQLQELNLEFTDITDDGLSVCEKLKGLQRLTLWNTRITDKGLRSLEDLHKLEHLSLSNTDITDAGLHSLRDLRMLRDLWFWQTSVSDLSPLSGLENLDFLSVGYTRVNDEQIDVLVGLSNLKQLDLVGCNISDAGLGKLHNLKSLSYVRLSSESISQSALEALKAALPNCEIAVH